MALVGLEAVTAGGAGSFGEFVGPDAYMRVARVLECIGGPGCPDGVFPRSNAPFGETLHWSYLLDWIILAGAIPFRIALDLREAVVASAHLVGPLLGLLALGAVVLLARPLVPEPGVRSVGLLFAFMAVFANAFGLARPDHHGLQGFAFLGATAGGMHLVSAEHPSARVSRVTGAFLGLAFWVSVEAAVALTPLLFVLALLWWARGSPELARANREVTLGAAVTLAVGLAVDGPRPDALAVEFDRFSVVHVVFFVLAAFFWVGASRLRLDSRARRGGYAAAGALAVGIVMWGAFPGVERGPLSGMDPVMWTLWLDGIAEYLPLWGRQGSVLHAPTLTLLAISLAISGMLAVRSKAARPGWGLLAACFLWFGGLALFQQVRWSGYLALLFPVPLAWLLGRVLARSAGIASTPLRSLARVAAVSGFAVGPLAAGSIALAWTDTSDGQAACSAGELARVLDDRPGREGAPGIVLAPMFWGPEILFRTRYDVVATPYHRNDEGIRTSHDIMAARDETEARRLLASRGIGWVAICLGEPWSPRVPEGDPEVFAGRLRGGALPTWTRPVALPGDLAGRYRLLEVVQGADGADTGRAPGG